MANFKSFWGIIVMKTATGNNEEKGMFPEITQKEKKAKRKAEMQENFYIIDEKGKKLWVFFQSREFLQQKCEQGYFDCFAWEPFQRREEKSKNLEDRCPNCGNIVSQNARGRRKKYCSERCRTAWNHQHPNTQNWKDTSRAVICPICGREFTAMREYGHLRKYCSRSCANRGRCLEKRSAVHNAECSEKNRNRKGERT